MKQVNFKRAELHVGGLEVFNKSYTGESNIHIKVSDLCLQSKSVLIMPYDEFVNLIQDKCENEEVVEWVEEVGSYSFNESIELMETEQEKEILKEVSWVLMFSGHIEFKEHKAEVKKAA